MDIVSPPPVFLPCISDTQPVCDAHKLKFTVIVWHLFTSVLSHSPLSFALSYPQSLPHSLWAQLTSVGHCGLGQHVPRGEGKPAYPPLSVIASVSFPSSLLRLPHT